MKTMKLTKEIKETYVLYTNEEGDTGHLSGDDLLRHGRRQRTYTLGHVYYWGWFERPVKFVKVTPKGFNFLRVKTNKCVFSSHFYCKGLGGKPVPPKQITFEVSMCKDLLMRSEPTKQHKIKKTNVRY